MKHRFFLSISLVLCAGLVACTKDYEPAPLGPDGHQKLSADQVFWNVVGKIVGMDQMTPDYKGKTFSPIIGEETEPGVRVVSVNSLRAAVDRFNGLTGANIDVNTPSYTWSNSEVGSITWNKGDGTTAWGTADLALPSVPSLTRIIYRSPEQGDTNGGVEGGIRAYYRFGDVISRTRPADKKGDVEFPAITEYWVCVRPAFHPEGKGESHWVSLSPLPRENVWPYYSDDYNYGPYPGSNGNGYGCPYNLGDDLEWLQDLNEMFYAIITAGANPQNFGNWYTNANNYYHEGWFGADGLLIFNDFTKENLQYHNDFFWQNVKKAWISHDLFNTLLGSEEGGVKHDQAWVSSRVQNGGQGLRYLHTGYSWWTWFSNDLDLYQATYKSVITDDHTQLNMHSVENKTVTKQVTNPGNTTDPATNIPFNVKTECSPERPFVINEKFFGDKEPRFIYRYATGEQLAKIGGGKWDARFALPGFQQVYRYYNEFEKGSYDNDKPEITEATGDGYVGRAHYRWGDVYKDEKGAKWFVINQAGYDTGMEGGEYTKRNERSPYSELVSFDNVGFDIPSEPSSNQRITNLPTRDQAIRAFMFLQLLYNRTHLMEEDHLNTNITFGYTTANLIEAASVDPRKLMQMIFMPNRNSSIACSIAYRPGAGDVEQPLLRCVINTKLENDNQPKYFFWTRYPSNPDTTTPKVTQFSNTLIHLQDLAKSNMVETYAKDYYVVCPLAKVSDPNSDESTPRTPRSIPDFSSRDISYYFYRMSNWNNKTDWTTFTDMWYEPILLFRYARVMDRGDTNYSTTTTDGHTLTLVKERNWSFGGSRDSSYDEVKDYTVFIWDSVDVDMFLNGELYHMPSWSELKENE
ncbi:MAG: hypothetical protein J6S97_00980 [Bacteroidales bacterium]|nr:hypothetical protein [Bacteroidales bacterium]